MVLTLLLSSPMKLHCSRLTDEIAVKGPLYNL